MMAREIASFVIAGAAVALLAAVVLLAVADWQLRRADRRARKTGGHQ